MEAPSDGHANEEAWRQEFGTLDGLPVEQLRDEYAELKRLGFTFRRFIKYNDFHQDESSYEKMGFENHADYLQLLSQAYLRFYCRKGWSKRYAELLDSGY